MYLGDAIKLHKLKKNFYNVEPKIFEKKCEDIWQAKLRGRLLYFTNGLGTEKVLLTKLQNFL